MGIADQLNDLKRKVDFNTYDISVKELLSMVSDEIIDIAPEYQRQFRWKDERQSMLIESIFLGIPVPSLFMATNPDGTWELIDGVQRLSTLVHFSDNEGAKEKTSLRGTLRLNGLSKLTEFEGKTFDELHKSIQLEFLLKPLKITTLSDKSDLEVRFDLFERLNTGGIVLTNQEIRACVFRGQFNDFIKAVSDNEDFRRVVRLSSAQESDGTREEYVLKFFAYLDRYRQFDHSVVDFLNEYMLDSTKRFNYRRGSEIFEETFSQLNQLPNGITRNRTTTPANLFEAVAVGAALAIQETGGLDLEDTTWIASNELKALTTGATNSRPRVVGRIEFCRDRFLGR